MATEKTSTKAQHLPDSPYAHVYRVSLEDLARSLIENGGMDPLRFEVDCCKIKVDDGMQAGQKMLEITVPVYRIEERATTPEEAGS